MRYWGTTGCAAFVLALAILLASGPHVAAAATQAPAGQKPAQKVTSQKPTSKKRSATPAAPARTTKPRKASTATGAKPARAKAALAAPTMPQTAARAQPTVLASQAAAEPEQPSDNLRTATQPASAEPVTAASAPVADSQPTADTQPAAPPAAASQTDGDPLPLAVLGPAVAEEYNPAEPEDAAAESSAEPGSAQEPDAAAAPRIGVSQAIVLGIVEGLTEYLPVSSTGHLILAGYWMGLTQEGAEDSAFGGKKIEQSPAIDAFEIVIQLGAILAVVGLYRKRVGQMARGVVGRSPQGLRLALLLLVAFLPAAIVGLALKKMISAHLFAPMPVVLALAAGGVLMIVIERFFWTRRKDRIHAAMQTRSLAPVGVTRSDSTGPMMNYQPGPGVSSHFTKIETMLFWQALVIGLAQCLSLWPGTSRSMVTILAALVVGLDMVAAAEFSFLLALPTLGAATLYSAAKHWDELMQASGPAGLLVGLIVSGIVAAIAVKAFIGWLGRHGLMPFGVYRIVIALVLMLYLLG